MQKIQSVSQSAINLKQKFFHKQTTQLSQELKNPQLFKWKTASLVLGSLAVVLLIIILVVVYNIQSQKQTTLDLTFLSQIVKRTQILTNKQQILHLSTNFQQIYGTTKFNSAKYLGSIDKLSQFFLKNTILYEENQHLLFLVKVSVTNLFKQFHFAVFMNSAFPLPQEEDFNYNITYYSFQAKQQRKSSLISLYSNRSLKLYAKNPQVTSISQCRTYNFHTNKETGQSFHLLNDTIKFNLKQSTIQDKQFQISGKSWKCFTPQLQNQQKFKERLIQIFDGINYEKQEIIMEKVQVYYLQ